MEGGKEKDISIDKCSGKRKGAPEGRDITQHETFETRSRYGYQRWIEWIKVHREVKLQFNKRKPAIDQS